MRVGGQEVLGGGESISHGVSDGNQSMNTSTDAYQQDIAVLESPFTPQTCPLGLQSLWLASVLANFLDPRCSLAESTS